MHIFKLNNLTTISFLCNSAVINKMLFYRYIYVSDILDHEIDVFERQEGQQLVYIKVI